MVATLSRCIWFTDTKLPSMNLAWCELVLAVAMHCYILYLCYKFKDTLYLEPALHQRAYVLIGVAAVLASIFHPGKKGTYFFTQQMFVSFTMFVEALSLTS